MWPLGQPHKLWLVPNLSARGPLKATAQLQPNQLSSTVQPYSPSADWVVPQGTIQLPACMAQPHTLYQITFEMILTSFTHLSARAQGSLLLLSLTLTCKHVHIIIMNYLVACVCRIETDSASWFVCNWFVCNGYCVQCIMYIAIVCIGSANKVEAIKVSTGSYFTFMNAMLNI